MRIGFRFIEPNIEIFVCPGDVEFRLIIPEDRLRTPAGREIANSFLADIWSIPGIKIPYGEIAYLMDQLEVIFSSETSGNGLGQS